MKNTCHVYVNLIGFIGKIKQLADNQQPKGLIVVYLDTLTFVERKNIIYHDSSIADSTWRYSYATEKDSFFYESQYCEPIDTLLMPYKGRNIQLIKSYYDVENSVDEESYIYWNRWYGLIAIYNRSQGALILFDHEKLKGFAKDYFYKYIIHTEKENAKRFSKAK